MAGKWVWPPRAPHWDSKPNQNVGPPLGQPLSSKVISDFKDFRPKAPPPLLNSNIISESGVILAVLVLKIYWIDLVEHLDFPRNFIQLCTSKYIDNFF